MNAFPVFDVRYIKTKKRTYGDNVYTNFLGSNMPEDDIEYESFTNISIHFLLVYENKCYLQVYLNNCTDKIVDKQMIDYLGGNLFLSLIKISF